MSMMMIMILRMILNNNDNENNIKNNHYDNSIDNDISNDSDNDKGKENYTEIMQITPINATLMIMFKKRRITMKSYRFCSAIPKRGP